MEIKFRRLEKQIYDGPVLRQKYVKCSKFMSSLYLGLFKYKLLFKTVCELLMLIYLMSKCLENMCDH